MNHSLDQIYLFNEVTKSLRHFFWDRGFIEVHTQDRLSILAACEDPLTISLFEYQNHVWPLPQTGQMWLEYEILRNPGFKGVFCLSTSYRQEPNPIPGRHETIFPMFEFESHGTMDDLRRLEKDLCEHIGFGPQTRFAQVPYVAAKKRYQVPLLTSVEEKRILKDDGFVVFLENFPNDTMPFWNMKQNQDYAYKIDVIINGIETIGSAERSTDKEQMRHCFATISDGIYARLLYEKFGKERVNQELEEYLSFDFFPRFGGGIGVRRLMSGLDEWRQVSEETSDVRRMRTR